MKEVAHEIWINFVPGPHDALQKQSQGPALQHARAPVDIAAEKDLRRDDEDDHPCSRQGRLRHLLRTRHHRLVQKRPRLQQLAGRPPPHDSREDLLVALDQMSLLPT